RESRVGRDLDRRTRRDLGRVEKNRDGPLLAWVDADRRLLEAHRRLERDSRRSRWRLTRDSLSFGFLDRTLCGCPAAGEAGLSRRVEGRSERVVQGPQPDLVSGRDLLACADETGTRAPLFRLDDRTDDALDRRVQAFHERVGIVEAAAVDADYNLRPR